MSSRDRIPYNGQRRSTEADVENLNNSATVLTGPKKMSVPREKRSNTVMGVNKLEKDSRNGTKLSNGQH